MNILYIGYWPLSDPLTIAVINPRLEILSKMNVVKNIFFCSFERGTNAIVSNPIPKVEYVHFISYEKRNVLTTKFSDFTTWPKFLKSIVVENKIDLIIGNSPFAGGAAYLVWRSTKTPFIVECFEPHADSMLESGVWKRWDPRYLALKYLESKQKKIAWKLQVVSNHYKAKLKSEGVPTQKISMLANCLSIEDFAFNRDQRIRIRTKLGFSESDKIGIYVGKFGGIYYDQEAFELFVKAFRFFGESFRLIILTGENTEKVINNLSKQNVDVSRVFVSSVPHAEVMHYLSAADFAFATIKATPIRLYCCPVKNGEYWANGLPILLEDGIGDDSDIIKSEGGGIILGKEKMDSFQSMKDYMSVGRENLSLQIKPIAINHRRLELITNYYEDIVDQFKSQHLPIALLMYKLSLIFI
jgi:hypothetical protein